MSSDFKKMHIIFCSISVWLTWKMTKFVHELLLHVVVVMARVMLWMGVLVVLVVLMVLSVRVLVVGGLCSFLWFRFGRLRSPSGPDPVAGQPHVSCQGLGSSRAVINSVSV